MGARLGLALVAAIAAVALLSLVWTPYDVAAIDVAARLQFPSAAHLLGTDQLGRDVLSLVMAGAQVSLGVALAAVAGGILLGVPAGLLAAERGGLVDEAVMRLSDIAFAMPALILAILLAAVIGPGAAGAALAIAIFNVPVFARVTRMAAAGLWTRDFVLAARAAGKTRMRISIEHILPNVTGAIAVQATVQASLGLIAEAGLSYVGLGAQPPAPSWGRMLAEAQTLIADAPWLVLAPGGAIVLAVLGFNLAGDAIGRRVAR